MRPKDYIYTEEHRQKISEANSDGKGSSSFDSINKRALTKGVTNWSHCVIGLDKELAAFKRCHDRVRDGKVCEIFWERNLEGFIGFIREIGAIETGPFALNKPSVGRENHAKGYIPGNIKWQEHKENSILRKGTKYESRAYKT